MTEVPTYTFKDFASDQEVRWCPGCGDYVILRGVQKALPMMGKRKEDFVFVSGIGCSSRFPYYLDTYGFHSIHGRAPAVATGVKLANPHLSVWVITGDGDGLAIGGNHMIHAIRRNINLNIVLFNNKIYGLTKGQFSPTSDLGHKTKSSPYGNIQAPFNFGELTIGAAGQFYARIPDNNPNEMADIMVAAEKHKGASVIEILQNCVIFNDGAFDGYTDKTVRDDAMISLKHGEKMIFGKEKNKGIRFNGRQLEAVTIGENGITENDILVHDAHDPNPSMHFMLTQLQHPLPIGIIRSVEVDTFDDRVEDQVQGAQQRSKFKSVDDLLFSGETYQV
ncbi:MAG: 2-oxoacid:ferredoxin oxidoreductase subunit beta [Saprospirales bacterium]|nr:2-oxoacid:ferredoxin oxidoreductase subunit beta [Saprospirales bacterium]MBK6902349.1 2-oxoacid:ferredoxin oxidoreductase subunit beta [Saprospirales bacterium]